MAQPGKAELIVNAGTQRSKTKRGPFHQRAEGGFERIYRKASEVTRELGPQQPKTRGTKSRLRKEITVRTFGAPRTKRTKLHGKRTTKWTGKK